MDLNLQAKGVVQGPTDRALRRKGFGAGVRVSVWCVNEGEALESEFSGEPGTAGAQYGGAGTQAPLEGFTLPPSDRKS